MAVELKVIPAKKYVRLQYIPVNGQEAYCRFVKHVCVMGVFHMKRRVYRRPVPPRLVSNKEAFVAFSGRMFVLR